MTDEKKFLGDFKLEFCNCYEGTPYRHWLRFCLCDNLPFGSLEGLGNDLLNEFEKTVSLKFFVDILSAIAELTQITGAIECVNNLRKKINHDVTSTNTETLKSSRITLFLSLREILQEDLQKIVSNYNLTNLSFENIWEFVFYLEKQRKLHTEDEVNFFKQSINPRARHILDSYYSSHLTEDFQRASITDQISRLTATLDNVLTVNANDNDENPASKNKDIRVQNENNNDTIVAGLTETNISDSEKIPGGNHPNESDSESSTLLNCTSKPEQLVSVSEGACVDLENENVKMHVVKSEEKRHRSKSSQKGVAMNDHLLDRALAICQDQPIKDGLTQEIQYELRLELNPDTSGSVVQYWKDLARHLGIKRRIIENFRDQMDSLLRHLMATDSYMTMGTFIDAVKQLKRPEVLKILCQLIVDEHEKHNNDSFVNDD